MRKTSLVALLSGLLLFSQTPAHADNFYCQDPCGSCLDGFAVGADFLYWDACVNDLDYAVLFDGNPTILSTNTSGTYRYVEPSYEPGFRIWLGKENVWCNWDIWASYTWYKSTESRHVEPGPGQTLFSSFEHGGFNISNLNHAYGNYSLTYQTFDVVFGQKLCASECHVFEPFFGLQGVKIQQKRNYNGRNTSDSTESTRWDSDTKALGLEIGSRYAWDLGCGFNFFGVASFSVVAGHDDANTHIFVDDEGINSLAFVDDTCICLPGMHLAAGFGYHHDWCGRDIFFRIGYEFTDWWNVGRARRWTNGGNDIGISSSPQGANLVLHGLFVGLGVGF